jgi:hypothetical protein
VRLPQDILHRDDFTPVLQDYWSVLDAAGCFAGLSWSDAKAVAATVSFDLVTRDDGQAFIRRRARNVLGGDGMMWDDRQGAARPQHRRDGARAVSRETQAPAKKRVFGYPPRAL